MEVAGQLPQPVVTELVFAVAGDESVAGDPELCEGSLDTPEPPPMFHNPAVGVVEGGPIRVADRGAIRDVVRLSIRAGNKIALARILNCEQGGLLN